MYLESRGMIPVDQSQGDSRAQQLNRRHNISDRDEAFGQPQSGATSRSSTPKWPPSRYPYSNHTSLESPRMTTNEVKDNVSYERNDLRRTPNPFNDNFSPSVINQNVHGANIPPQQIPQTLHSSSALHMEEAYLQQVSPVYLEQHSIQQSQLQDTEAFQCCENYSESPQSSSNFQAYRYVEGAVMEDRNQATNMVDGMVAEPYEESVDAFTPLYNGIPYQNDNTQPSQLEENHGSNLYNETQYSVSTEGKHDSNRHSSVGSSVSHPNSGTFSFSKTDDNVFQVDQSSLENPTFKVHAKVIPNITPKGSTNSDVNNEFENTDADVAEDSSIPKSDSINIFSIQSDPFDDAFFKF